MKLIGQIFLLSALFTFTVAIMAFPVGMTALLHYFPEEYVDLIYFISTIGLWMLVFLIMYFVVKREND